ncbi:MAG: exodeoxyribonuclease VII large subunit [Chlamydiales bacterium]|nr:exodeoxyribonuclease VII large subunit [Chlamydiales bacterium]
MSKPIPLTVSQLTSAIKGHLEPRFRDTLLQGEISNFKAQSSGHLYFSLKDDLSQIAAVMFRGNTLGLNPLPKSGDHVIVKGEISVYEPRGSYQIIVRELYYVGLGALLLKLEQLKMKLQQMGWFDSARKKPLPKFPKRIGVITSPSGAVIQDILNVLTRRNAGFFLILNPVKVQGEGSALEIAKAIDDMNRYELADVLIVGRGGGSIEDLWAFNEEVVAASILASKIPVISAVGHESDTCLSDLVADVRAPTPSAAAEIVTSEKKQHEDFLIKTKKNLSTALFYLLRHYKQRLLSLAKHPLLTTPYSIVGKNYLRLDELRGLLDDTLEKNLIKKRNALNASTHKLNSLKPQNELLRIRQKLHFLETNLNNRALQSIRAYHTQLPGIKKEVDLWWKNSFHLRKERLKGVVSKLSSLDPKNLLRKGYAILFSEKDQSLIISAKNVNTGDLLFAKLADGTLSLIVNKTSN